MWFWGTTYVPKRKYNEGQSRTNLHKNIKAYEKDGEYRFGEKLDTVLLSMIEARNIQLEDKIKINLEDSFEIFVSQNGSKLAHDKRCDLFREYSGGRIWIIKSGDFCKWQPFH